MTEIVTGLAVLGLMAAGVAVIVIPRMGRRRVWLYVAAYSIARANALETLEKQYAACKGDIA